MAVEQQFLLEFRRPTGLDKFQITALVRTIDLVANEGKTERGQVNPDLMGSTRDRLTIDEREPAPAVFESLDDGEFGFRSVASGMNGLFQPDLTRHLFALAKEWLIDLKSVGLGPTLGDCCIKFVDSMMVD